MAAANHRHLHRLVSVGNVVMIELGKASRLIRFIYRVIAAKYHPLYLALMVQLLADQSHLYWPIFRTFRRTFPRRSRALYEDRRLALRRLFALLRALFE